MKRHVNTSTGLIILFAFAVIFFGGAYTYANLCIAKTTIRLSSAFFTAKADPTKNWKTYQDKNYGFSFKYPQEWASGSTFGRELIFGSSQQDVDILTGKSKAELSTDAIRLDVMVDDVSKYATEKAALNSLDGRKATTFTFSDIKLGDRDAVMATRTVKKGEQFSENPSVAKADTKEIVYNMINGPYLMRFWFTTEGNNDYSTLANRIVQTATFSPVDPTSSWQTFSLGLTKSSIKYPSDWKIEKSSDTSHTDQSIYYHINKGDTGTNNGSITEYDVVEWLKGVGPDEGYVLSKEQRASLLNIMKEIYSAGAVTDSIKQELNKYSLEFLTYSATDRIYTGYVESKDGKAKGLSMINTHGQDYGLPGDYYSVLYNQDKNAVLVVRYFLNGPEIDKLRAEYNNHNPSELEQIDKDVHISFSNLMANTARNDLSFGVQMDKIDNIAKSWTF